MDFARGLCHPCPQSSSRADDNDEQINYEILEHLRVSWASLGAELHAEPSCLVSFRDRVSLPGSEQGQNRLPKSLTPLLPPCHTTGLLERPVLPPSVVIDTASYKIFVSGKSGVGKTALVAKLAGLEVPIVHHETTGE